VNFAGSNAKGEYEVVGIIDDVLQHGLNDPIQPEIYSLQHQTTFRSSMPGLIVRTNGDPRALINDLRSIVLEQDSSLALDSLMTMEDRVASTLARPRLYALLFGVFAISALVIATVGLFGVLSYSVSNRFREFALRAALGARPANVMGLVLKQGMAMTVGGLVLGILVSVAGMRYLSGLLYGVTYHDWISFSAVTVVIATITGAACVLPALRALRVDPIRALIAPRS
jgi:ABC-type antimicrobial peptide transport system permease subunit